MDDEFSDSERKGRKRTVSVKFSEFCHIFFNVRRRQPKIIYNFSIERR